MDYRRRLREIREDRDLTQKQIAKVIQKSQQGYSHIENGRAELKIEDLIAVRLLPAQRGLRHRADGRSPGVGMPKAPVRRRFRHLGDANAGLGAAGIFARTGGKGGEIAASGISMPSRALEMAGASLPNRSGICRRAMVRAHFREVRRALSGRAKCDTMNAKPKREEFP